MPPVVKRSLREIGLSDKESTVLLVLLEHGPMPAAAIAKAAKLNRTTTYGILKELAGRGLISSVKKEAATRYESIAPELLPAYIRRRQDSLAESEKEIQNILPQIKLLRSKSVALPKVRFFEGKEGVEQAYEDTLENNKGKLLQNILGIDAVYTKLDSKFVRYYLNKRDRLGIRSTYITPDTGLSRKYKEGEVRYIPEKYAMDTEICIYDNKVGIFSLALENPVALIIEDDTISHTMKQIFRYIESTAK